MTDLTIRTNNVPRYTIDGIDLTETERAEFDWMAPDELDCATFVRYRGAVYALSEFMHVPPTSFMGAASWDGIHNESYFSGVLIRFQSADCETVIMGNYYS